MHTTSSLLDAFKSKKGISSDYALAASLGISKQHISQYRRGYRCIGDDRAIQIAEELGLDPGEVLISLQAERAKKAHNDAAYFALAGTLRRLSGIAATILAVFLILPAQSADASMRLAFDDNANYRKHRPATPLRRLPFSLLTCINTISIVLRIVRASIHTAFFARP